MPIKLDREAYYNQTELREALKCGQKAIENLEIRNGLKSRRLGISLIYKGADVIEAIEKEEVM